MKKKFITYGSNAFLQSANRIVNEAKSLGIFNDFINYSEENLPLSIKSSPLFTSSKGGGFWLWKPYIIYNELLKSNLGDILVYADSGCTLQKSKKWDAYFEALQQTNILFFQYKSNFDYGWSKFNPKFTDSPQIKHWCKKKLILHFSDVTDVEAIIQKNKLLAGFIFIKNTKESQEIIKNWLHTMLFYPNLIVDPLISEPQEPYFSAHRHDQSVISILARIYEEKGLLKIIDEDFETISNDQVMRTLRKTDPIKKSNILKKILGKL